MNPSYPRWGVVRSVLALSPVLIGFPLLAFRQHNGIPKPLTDLVDPVSKLPQLSESRILEHVKHLSQDIGYRIVGTKEHASADTWMVERASAFKRSCEQAVANEPGRKLECEVWRQQGDGSHRFDLMGKRVYKTYVNITNIIVRVSDGTPASKEHAVLVNAHLDSTLPSPGAADDALSVGVMLECMRVLVETSGWSPSFAIIFLFNNAEESFQDASHLFSTQHPIRHTVRAAINLEAAGTTGRDLLFQATSEQMIQAYAQVPRPFGTILANDIFSSGFLLSDTDFRQFEHYLGVTGLDMAVVGNSYLYHMRKDVVENIQPGVAQHMSENVLALLRHLSSPSSPIPSLATGYTQPSTVFYSYLGYFWVYSFKTAKGLHITLLLVAITFVFFSNKRGSNGHRFWKQLGRATARVLAGITGALVGANLVAFVMCKALGKAMSWYSNVFAALALFAPPALFGALVTQLMFPPISEHSMFNSMLLLQCFGAWSLQAIGKGTPLMFFLSAFPLFIGLVSNDYLVPTLQAAWKVRTLPAGEVSLWTYAMGQASCLFSGTLLFIGVLEFFVPLTGRIGAVPADHIIATITAVIGSYCLPLSLPFAQRFKRNVVKRTVAVLGVISLLMIAVFSQREPFDAMHQKRVFIIHSENVTTSERYLHVASCDSAPGFPELVADITAQFGAPGTKPALEVMDDYNADWDSLYPFSAFIAPYKFPLPEREGYVAPFGSDSRNHFKVEAINDHIDWKAGTRSLTLKITHPGLIWTVIAFDAHVLQWSLDERPPNEYARHHVKEASFYDSDTWFVDLVIRHSPGSSGLQVNYIGIQEKGMWPAKKSEVYTEGEHKLAMALFEELDDWLDQKTRGTVDALLLACVGGVTFI